MQWGVFFFLVPGGAESLCKGLVCALMKRQKETLTVSFHTILPSGGDSL